MTDCEACLALCKRVAPSEPEGKTFSCDGVITRCRDDYHYNVDAGRFSEIMEFLGASPKENLKLVPVDAATYSFEEVDEPEIERRVVDLDSLPMTYGTMPSGTRVKYNLEYSAFFFQDDSGNWHEDPCLADLILNLHMAKIDEPSSGS